MKSRKRADFASPERLKKAVIAVEDLLFLFKQSRLEGLEVAVDTLYAAINAQSSPMESAVARGYQSADPNKHFLIGVLPRLLLDREIFPSNDDIVEFASVALKLDLKVEKRARFEIIGKIVCETNDLDEHQLTGLVRALEKLAGSHETREKMLERRKIGSFTWNETLQDLLKG